ncbi:hypothetical protein V8G54_018466 [Vigna mungo]|uniref:Uncharacterized protein n=1 Tax=Vigna mungo TaxID=3915 RepID=A0AAQ3N8U6_VIGMU
MNFSPKFENQIDKHDFPLLPPSANHTSSYYRPLSSTKYMVKLVVAGGAESARREEGTDDGEDLEPVVECDDGVREEISDRLRFFVEECDHIKYFANLNGWIPLKALNDLFLLEILQPLTLKTDDDVEDMLAIEHTTVHGALASGIDYKDLSTNIFFMTVQDVTGLILEVSFLQGTSSPNISKWSEPVPEPLLTPFIVNESAINSSCIYPGEDFSSKATNISQSKEYDHDPSFDMYLFCKEQIEVGLTQSTTNESEVSPNDVVGKVVRCMGLGAAPTNAFRNTRLRLSDLSLASSTIVPSSSSNEWKQKYNYLESTLKAYMIMKEGKIPNEFTSFFDSQPQEGGDANESESPLGGTIGSSGASNI